MCDDVCGYGGRSVCESVLTAEDGWKAKSDLWNIFLWQLKQPKITTLLFHNGCMYSLTPSCFTLCIQTAVIPVVQSRPGCAMPGRVTPVYRLKRAKRLPASDLHGPVWIQSVFGVNLYPQKLIIVINGSLKECDTVCWHAVCARREPRASSRQHHCHCYATLSSWLHFCFSSLPIVVHIFRLRF